MTGPQPYLPWGIRAVNAVGGLVNRIASVPSLEPDALIEHARKATGLSDLGPETYRPGLEALMDSLRGEARLNMIGRVFARQSYEGRLKDRLRLIDWRKRHPKIGEQRIERPIFVLGLPRTGTTILYGALAASPSLRSPVTWEMQFPIPPADPGTLDSDPRIEQMHKQYADLRRIVPDAEKVHAMGALLPQECIAMHTCEFKSLEPVVTFPIPSYFEWIKEHGIRSAYAFQREFLQHMQSGYARKHWLLKSPAHLMWLDQLLEEFPDALIVQTHRDPAKVIGSVSSLYATFDNAVTEHPDPYAVGRQQFEQWRWGLDRATQVRESMPDERVIDVQFSDIVRDPIGVVRSIHEKFGLDFDAETQTRTQAFLDDNARDKHGLHSYSLEDFGLDRAKVDAAFADYRAQYDVPQED